MKATAKAPAGSAREEHAGVNFVSPDQVYLMDKINDITEGKGKGCLTIAGIQKLNSTFGTERVTSAMRSVRGFPPEQLRAAYPYLLAVIGASLESE